MNLVRRSALAAPDIGLAKGERWIRRMRAGAALILFGPVLLVTGIAWLVSALVGRLWQGLSGTRRDDPFA